VALVLGALDAHRMAPEANSSGAIFRRVAASMWLLVVPPALILTINALFVANCDLLEGAVFYGMGAGLGVLFAGQLGAASGILTRSRLGGVALALALGLAWTARDLLHLYTDPPIFFFNPFVGFFSGAIYDDAIAVDGRFIAYRLVNAAQLLWLWLFVDLGWSEGRWSVAAIRGRGLRAAGGVWARFAAVSFLCGALFGARAPLGIEMSQEAIEAELGGRLTSGPITLVYDMATLDQEEAERLSLDARFRLDQLLDALEESAAEPMTIFVYGSKDQKRRLMGAARVQLAKPWLRQVHMDRPALGDPKLGHEIAHVLLGTYADTLLRVPARGGLLVNAGLVEGAAVALEPPSGSFDVHSRSAAMRALGHAPRLQRLLGPDGFWSQAAARAYTLTGSFLTWLKQTRGTDAFKSVYGSGDFETVYGEPIEALVADWEAWLDAREISPRLRAWADVIYRRQGVLHRTCPLEIARLEREAANLASAGDIVGAAAILEEVARHLPDSAVKLLRLAALRASSGSSTEALELVETGLALEDTPELIGARFREIRADVLWREGDPAAAAEIYAALAELPLSPDRWRLVALKADVARSPELEPIYGPYLLGGRRDVEIDIVYLTEAAAELQGEPLALYLLGRRTYQAGRPGEAVGPLTTGIRLLERGETRGGIGGRTATAVEREAWRVLGRALLDDGQLMDAEAAFARAAQLSPTTGARASLLDWGARASWLRRQAWLGKHGVF
jgi:tetratricopeptide (TPR) repeat protein